MSNEKKIANPAPLGLLGFGLTTILLNLHNLGLIPLSIVIIAMGIAMGGLAQFVAGIFEFKSGNLFGATAFTAYGCFWWSLIIILWTPFGQSADAQSKGWYLLLWGLFTFMMFIGTLKHNKSSQVIFLSLAILFILLSIGDFSGNELITKVAGLVGIFCGLVACYSSTAQVINNEFGKKILPL